MKLLNSMRKIINILDALIFNTFLTKDTKIDSVNRVQVSKILYQRLQNKFKTV